MQAQKSANPNILCKNNCGFYGNPSWGGYCSVCYRDPGIQQELTKKQATSLTDVSTQAFSRFETKRKQLAGKGANTLKNIFKFTKDGSRPRTPALPDECHDAVDEFNTFLDDLRPSISADISRQVSKLLECLENMSGCHIDQYSLVIQKFYQNIADRLATQRLYSHQSPKDTKKVLDSIERFLTTWIYCWAFASPITDDESLDLKLQEKIRSLHWVTPDMLASPINSKAASAQELIDTATFSLIRVNTFYSTEEKLEHIFTCCKSIFSLLKLNSELGNQENPGVTEDFSPTEQKKRSSVDESNQSAADDFLPTLIWVVLRANPPLLHSNLQFIMRFANQKHLNFGEIGYFFTNLSCAVHFIMNLTHESLHLTETEFYRCMRTGLPITKERQRKRSFGCEGDQQLADNEVQLLDLEDKFSNINQNLISLEDDFSNFSRTCSTKFQEIRNKFPLQLPSYNIDRDLIDSPDVLLLGSLIPPNNSTADDNASSRKSQLPSTIQVSLLDSDITDTVSQLHAPIVPFPASSSYKNNKLTINRSNPT